MNKLIMLLMLLVINCGGKDGENGKDGTNNRISSKIYCSGYLTTSTVFDNTQVTWDAIMMTSGDVMVAASATNLGSFNVSGVAFYAASQAGATTGSITLYPDNLNDMTIKYNPLSKNVIIQIVSTNGNGGYFSNTNACKIYTF